MSNCTSIGNSADSYCATEFGSSSRLGFFATVAEILLYAFFFLSAFLHLLSNLPNVAPAVLALATLCAVISNHLRLFKLPCIISWLIVATIFFMDFTFHKLDPISFKYYFFWAVLFTDFIILHENPNFFDRAKVILIIFLFSHFFFFDPHPLGSRLALRHELHLSMANSNNLAYWCGFGTLMGIIEFTKKHKYREIKILSLILVVVCSLVLLGTVSRGALLALLSGVTCYFLITSKDKDKLIGFILLIFIFATFGYLFQKQLIKDIKQYKSRIATERYYGYRMSGRVPALIESIKTIKRNPLLGTGTNDIKVRGEFVHTSHNAFLIMGVHYGLLPVFWFSLLWIMVWFKVLGFLVKKRSWPDDSCLPELVAFSVFLFLMTNMSNFLGMSGFFSILYMTKILTTTIYK